MEFTKIKKHPKVKSFIASLKKTPKTFVDTTVFLIEQTRIYLVLILTSLVTLVKDVSDTITPVAKPTYAVLISSLSYRTFLKVMLYSAILSKITMKVATLQTLPIPTVFLVLMNDYSLLIDTCFSTSIILLKEVVEDSREAYFGTAEKVSKIEMLKTENQSLKEALETSKHENLLRETSLTSKIDSLSSTLRLQKDKYLQLTVMHESLQEEFNRNNVLHKLTKVSSAISISLTILNSLISIYSIFTGAENMQVLALLKSIKAILTAQQRSDISDTAADRAHGTRPSVTRGIIPDIDAV